MNGLKNYCTVSKRTEQEEEDNAMVSYNGSASLARFPFPRYRMLSIIAWTAFCIAVLMYELSENREFTERSALTMARVAIEKDIAFRRWAAGHGGVYVPVTAQTPPNPWLKAEERDISTPSGKGLTLMNPAYMTRQLFEQLNSSSPDAPRGHLTSLKPVRPDNAPDRWETEALKRFEKGATEFGEMQVMNGVSYYRYMRPLKMEKGCLACHAAHGYLEGDLRGGISVAVPVAPLRDAESTDSRHHEVMFLLSWLTGCTGICFAFRRIMKANSTVTTERNNLTSIFDAAPVGMLLLDETGSVVRVNHAARQLAGKSPEMAAEPTFGALLGCSNSNSGPTVCGHADECDACGFMAAIRQTLEKGKSVSGEHQLKCGSDNTHAFKWLRFNIEPMRLDERNYALISLDNVTEYHLAQETLQEQTYILEEEIAERQSAQEALQEQAALLEEEVTERLAINETLAEQNIQLEREARERMEAERRLIETQNRIIAVFQAIPDLVWLKNRDGVYLACNPAFEGFFGARQKEIVGKTDYDFVDTALADFFRQKDLESIEAGCVQMNEEWITYRETGRRGLLETRKVPVFGSNNEVVGVLGIARDITEQKSIKEQLLQSQKMESVGRLTGGIAHDFNNILTPIIGYAETLKWNPSLDSKGIERVDRILLAADRARALVNQLLSFSRKQHLEMHIVDFNQVVGSICGMLRSSIRETIDIRFTPSMTASIVRGDRNQLEQIVMNLVVNAQDAIAGNGNINVEIANVLLDEEQARLHVDAKPGRYCLFSVSDTGCGIDGDTLEHIFEPFYTTKDTGKGTGLGLATVYGLVKQHNGSISVSSEPGHGTVFTILLPAVDAEPQDEAPRSEETTLFAGNDRHVLVVEDNAMVREMVVELLTCYGFRVHEAETPIKALQSIEGHPVELLITDVVMPGMNGPELHGKLLTSSPGLKVIYMSGYNDNLITSHGVLDEGTEFIQKPFSILEMTTKLKSVLG